MCSTGTFATPASTCECFPPTSAQFFWMQVCRSMSSTTLYGRWPKPPDNRWLRDAMRQIPIIYFFGISPRRYQPILPTFIVGSTPINYVFSLPSGRSSGHRQAQQHPRLRCRSGWRWRPWVPRRMELEQEKLAGPQGLKVCSASRLPEITSSDLLIAWPLPTTAPLGLPLALPANVNRGDQSIARSGHASPVERDITAAGTYMEPKSRASRVQKYNLFI